MTSKIGTIETARLIMLMMSDNKEFAATQIASVLDLFATEGFNKAIEIAKKRYSELHQGSCFMLTLGDKCICFLCSMDKLR